MTDPAPPCCGALLLPPSPPVINPHGNHHSLFAFRGPDRTGPGLRPEGAGRHGLRGCDHLTFNLNYLINLILTAVLMRYSIKCYFDSGFDIASPGARPSWSARGFTAGGGGRKTPLAPLAACSQPYRLSLEECMEGLLQSEECSWKVSCRVRSIRRGFLAECP